MRNTFIAFACGLIFALGLGLSGMTQPGKVTAFLDFTGAWDPTLLFVMGGAVGLYALGYRWIRRRGRPLWSEEFKLPAAQTIDRRLLMGAALFGIGWGLSGFCPGPVIVSAVTGRSDVFLFLIGLVSGMALFAFTRRRIAR